VAISAEGDIAISGAYRHFGTEKEIRVWDLSSGKQLREIRTDLNGIFGLALSPDCQYVFAGGGGVVVEGGWQYTSGVEVRKLDGTGKVTRLGKELFFVKSIAFSSDRELFLTSNLRAPNAQGHDDERCVRIWRTSTFAMISAFGQHQVGIKSACFSPDGQRVAFASNQIGTSKPLARPNRQTLLSKFHLDRGVEVRLHDLNSTIPLIRVWNVGAQREESPLQLPKGRVEQIAFSPTGRILASAGSTLIICDFRARTVVKELDLGPHAYNNCVAFSPDGVLLASGGGYQFEPGSPYRDCGVKLWDVESGDLTSFLPHQGPVYSLTFSPDGRTLVAGGESGELLTWNL
jgi:WD40 repeat protein